MLQKDHRLILFVWTVRLSVFALLSFGVVSAVHIHGGGDSGEIRHECTLCVSGIAQTAALASSPAIGPLLVTIAFTSLFACLLSLTIYQSVAGPRAPPIFV